MSSSLQIAIAADYSLAEKITQTLEKSELAHATLTIIETTPFNEEQHIRFNGKSVAQLSLQETDWLGFDFLFFAGSTEILKDAIQAANDGCVLIDVLGISALMHDIPSVLPQVNEHKLVDLRPKNVVAVPDPLVSHLALSLQPILSQTSDLQIYCTSLIPAAYVNNDMVSQLVGQTAQLLNGIPLDEQQTRLAFNVQPYQAALKSAEHLTALLTKILPQLNATTQWHNLQVPVFYGLSQLISITSDYPLDTDIITQQWQNNPLIEVHNDHIITPVINGEQEANSEQLAKLHINLLQPLENAIQFWLVADEQQFSRARLSVDIAEKIYQQGY